MDKIDLKKDFKHLYLPSPKAVVEVDVPAMNYLMIDGEGDPNTAQSYADAITCLFTISYTLKFMIKKGPLAIDYGVMPLESLWWADDMSVFGTNDKSQWKWTAMIMQPSFITKELIETASKEAAKKKELAALSILRFESMTEGKCAQILHIGPFSEEGPTIIKVHKFIEEMGKERKGKHHEIYLSDIRKAAPSKWKTVVRQPFE